MTISSVPVLTYHTIRPGGPITPALFERQLQWLRESGFRTIHCQEMLDHLRGSRRLDQPAVQITFDDGWRDNWVYAWPLLEKYQVKATIFLITARIGEQPDVRRPTLADVWRGRASKAELPALRPTAEAFLAGPRGEDSTGDFLAWPEIATMVRSGLVEVQSHSHTHAWCFTGPEVADFNRLKHWKIAWATDGDFRLGIPEYIGSSALLGPRWHDPVAARDALHAEIVRVGGGDWLNRRGGKEKFRAYCRRFYDSLAGDLTSGGWYEESANCYSRIREEFVRSRQTIIDRIGSGGDFFCWPWGNYSAESIAHMLDAGYLGGYSLDRGPNVPGTPLGAIRRFEVRPRGMLWFASRLRIYRSPRLARLYGAIMRQGGRSRQ